MGELGDLQVNKEMNKIILDKDRLEILFIYFVALQIRKIHLS